MSSNKQNEFDVKFFQLLAQYAMLQSKIGPLVGAASQKLVKDLVDSGCQIEHIAKVVKKSPGFIHGVYAGKHSLNAQQTVRVLQHGIRSGENIAKD